MGSNLLLPLLHAAIHGGDVRVRAYRDVFTASLEGPTHWQAPATRQTLSGQTANRYAGRPYE
jgi:hypothetical protein